MKDPRPVITMDTYSHALMVLVGVVVTWTLVGIWFDIPSLAQKVIATVVIVAMMLLLTWPVLKKVKSE